MMVVSEEDDLLEVFRYLSHFRGSRELLLAEFSVVLNCLSSLLWLYCFLLERVRQWAQRADRSIVPLCYAGSSSLGILRFPRWAGFFAGKEKSLSSTRIVDQPR